MKKHSYDYYHLKGILNRFGPTSLPLKDKPEDIHNITDKKLAEFIGEPHTIISYAKEIANDQELGTKIRKYLIEERKRAYIESYNYGNWANTPEKYELLKKQIKEEETKNKK